MNPRELSRLQIVQALYRHPGASKTELAAFTSIPRATVSSLVDEFVRAGLVATREEEEERPRQSGRPRVPLALVPRAAFAIGLDIGHQHVRAAVCDLSGELLSDEFSRAEVDHAPTETLDLAEQLVRAALERAQVPLDHVIGVGMGLAAPVDATRGVVFAEGILPAWGGVQPAAELQRRLGLDVLLDNDANLGAVGEQVLGAGQGTEEMVYVRLSAGIGLGMILRGRPYGGSIGIAGELGHVRVAPDGLICRCGNRGCLETVASPQAVTELLARSRDEAISVPRLLQLVSDGDRGARRAVAEAGKAVGAAIATVVTLLNPQLVVIGGELAGAGGALLDPIRAAIDEYSVAPAAASVRVVTGTLGERAEVLGAAALVLAQTPRALVERLSSA